MPRFLFAHFEEILGSVLLAVMAAIAFINVIVRYCSSFSFAWTEELTVNFFVWVTLLGTARAFRDGTHLAMSIIYDSLPKKGTPPLLSACLPALRPFFGALVWTGSIEVMDEYELDAISESLGIPVWWYTIATPAFSLLVILRMLERARQDLRNGTY